MSIGTPSLGAKEDLPRYHERRRTLGYDGIGDKAHSGAIRASAALGGKAWGAAAPYGDNCIFAVSTSDTHYEGSLAGGALVGETYGIRSISLVMCRAGLLLLLSMKSSSHTHQGISRKLDGPRNGSWKWDMCSSRRISSSRSGVCGKCYGAAGDYEEIALSGSSD
ncbi:hypothetical protein HAX54_033534 [Datura stramonium]|uniref:Uncharacterized protein n=1 Tax=Datura stramonium TaxID=4076 RepID=A0ABS8RQ55_DATST|nr:hypothetical protein [Datura stramonium]